MCLRFGVNALNDVGLVSVSASVVGIVPLIVVDIGMRWLMLLFLFLL